MSIELTLSNAIHVISGIPQGCIYIYIYYNFGMTNMLYVWNFYMTNMQYVWIIPTCY